VKRRTFIAGLGGAAAWPVVARAQQQMPTIGWLSITAPGASPALPFFKRGLAELGYDEGRNVSIEYQWAEFHPERFPELAANLVQKPVSLIAAVSGLPAIRAAKDATTEIPIVFLVVDDPVRLGLVASLNRPGGNLTGVAALTAPVVMKQIELMNEVFPGNSPIDLLIDPAEAADIENAAHIAEQKLNRRVNAVRARSESDFDSALTTVANDKAAALVVTAQPLFVSHYLQLAGAVARYAIPTVYSPVDLAKSGGLMSFGGSIFDMFHRVGNLAGKVLAGAKPADLPVELPAKFELKLNLKTAKALGISFPLSVLARADEVIE
jgi:putative tryptophan/tyrosine transport system substrate-binding protein